jgi:flagellar basal-body rod protein FlgC
MFGSFDISTSALTAQRVRLDTISSNIAHFGAAAPAAGKSEPYRRLYPVFESGRNDAGASGVRVASIQEDDAPLVKKFEGKTHPYADKDGFVSYPNVDLSTEMVNAIEVTRAYEANVTAVETTKSMMSATMRILA